MNRPAKTAMPAMAKKARTYHFHVQPQKNRPGSEPRYMLIYSDNGRPIDMDGDDEDYNTMNIGREDLDRLFAATLRAYIMNIGRADLDRLFTTILRAYGVSINDDEVAKFQMNARVAPILREENAVMKKQIEVLQSQLKAANGTIKRLQEQAPVQSVNGKVGHVVLTRGDITNFEEGNPIPAECGVESVNGKVGHVHLTTSDFPAPQPTSQITQNLIDVGMRVRHKHMGEGTVVAVHMSGTPEATVVVDFDEAQRPVTLLLAVSGLEIISTGKAAAQAETLTFDETDHPDEPTPAKLQQLTYLIPKDVCVTRFLPRSLGLLCCPDGAQYPLYTDLRIRATNPDGSTVDEIVRFMNPSGQARVEDFVETSTPYSTVALMVKES